MVGTVIFGLGGLDWSLPLLFFFFSSSFLSLFGKRKKKALDSVFEKGEKRDFMQVFSNGSLPMFLVIFHFFFPGANKYVLYLACLSCATADTWGTEIGVLSSQVVWLKNFKKVSSGTSGAVSTKGTIASLVGAFFLVLVGGNSLLSPYLLNKQIFLKLVLAGFSGSIIDSFLGAFLQAQYLCPVCKVLTEKKAHCHKKTILSGGLRYLQNDAVNFLACFSTVIWMWWLL